MFMSIHLITDLTFFEVTVREDLEAFKASPDTSGYEEYEKDLNALIDYAKTNGFVEGDFSTFDGINFENYNDIRYFRLHLAISIICRNIQEDNYPTPDFIYSMRTFLETPIDIWLKKTGFNEDNFTEPHYLDFT